LCALFFSACDALNNPIKEDIEYNLSFTPVTTGEALAEAITGLPPGGSGVFTLVDDITLSGPLAVDGKTVALEGYSGRTVRVSRGPGYTGKLFTVPSGGSLVLGGGRNRGRGTLVLDGESAATADPLIEVIGGSLTLNSGAELRNNDRPGANGGGVAVDGGTFTMTGGTVSGNKANNGGGVHVTGGGAFTMTGGTISGNTASNDGGGASVDHGTFTMYGGNITGNTVTVYSAGGLALNAGTFTIYGGSISGNIARNNGGGVMLTGYELYSGYIPAARGRLTMYGGSISRNTSANGSGGGIVLQGNVEFTLYGGTISGNKANSGYGGGIFFNDGDSRFTMEGGTVSGNMASGYSSRGGGVYVKNSDDSFTMNGGTIGENTADNGNGVYFNDGAFTMGGSGAVLPGNVVYLPSGKMITVTGALNPPGGIAAVIKSEITASGTPLVTGSPTPADVGKFRYNDAGTLLDDTTSGAGKIP
jgi:hypothetical protein